jgi:multimeric flavodoxin WrbA
MAGNLSCDKQTYCVNQREYNRIMSVTKKMLVLTGSPRLNGICSKLTSSFIKEIRHKGYDVMRFDAAFMRISGCRSCNSCFRNGKACIFEDDFNKFAESVKSADSVMIITPVYCCSLPSQIKAVFDKMFSFYNADINVKGKKCGIIACVENRKDGNPDGGQMIVDFDGRDPKNGVIIPYKSLMHQLKWNSVVELFFDNDQDKQEISLIQQSASMVSDNFK